jgi:hypothetical protein
LQNVYEIILNKTLLTPNFRRKIKSQYIIDELKDIKKVEAAGRPSRLLVFKKKGMLLNR